jgi:subtilisin family serine protease
MLYARKSLSRVLPVLLLIALLAGCYPVTPTPAPTSAPVGDDETTCMYRARTGIAKQTETPKGMKRSPFQGLMYVDRQVLVGGDRAAISQLVSSRNLPLRPYKEDPGIPAGKQVIQLFEITDRQASVEYVTCLINEYAAKDKVLVYADPNYTVTPGGWYGGGSPWTQNGSWAQPGGGLGTTDRDGFLDQWAFGLKGIALRDGGKRTVAPEGQGIAIAILDTSPFQPSFEQPSFFDTVFEKTLSTKGPSGSKLILHDAQPQPVPSCPGSDHFNPAINRENRDLSSHGLFVAGLAHAVAPQSDIYLVQVLNDDACGDLYTILRGLQWFEDQMKETGRSMDKTVINLSLGLNRPDEEMAASLGLPSGPEVRTLQTKIGDLVEIGATVVAASGNDSFSQPTAASPEIPAQDPGVIAVAASAIDQTRSCFSNEGALAAPGGNGIDPENYRTGCLVPGQMTTPPGQLPRPGVPWACETDPEYCVVSLVWRGNTHRFAYWAGTSFATPMVSGLAALLLGSGQTPAEVKSTLVTEASPVAPDESLGAGIVNVPNAVAAAPIP